MKAGRELDTKVAKEVMGWIKVDGGWVGKEHKLEGWPTSRSVIVWSPSTKIYHAWEVVEKIQESGFGVRMNIKPKKVRVDIEPVDLFQDGWTSHRAVAETAPLAICLAAFKAMEAKK